MVAAQSLHLSLVEGSSKGLEGRERSSHISAKVLGERQSPCCPRRYLREERALMILETPVGAAAEHQPLPPHTPRHPKCSQCEDMAEPSLSQDGAETHAYD